MRAVPTLAAVVRPTHGWRGEAVAPSLAAAVQRSAQRFKVGAPLSILRNHGPLGGREKHQLFHSISAG
jgi:hypothetical protein